jgi:hypothetical protein
MQFYYKTQIYEISNLHKDTRRRRLASNLRNETLPSRLACNLLKETLPRRIACDLRRETATQVRKNQVSYFYHTSFPLIDFNKKKHTYNVEHQKRNLDQLMAVKGFPTSTARRFLLCSGTRNNCRANN